MKITFALMLIRLLSWFPLRLLYWLAVPAAWLLSWLPWRKHQTIRTNLEIAFPDASSRAHHRMHRQNLIEMVRLMLEMGAVWYWPAPKIRRAIRHVKGQKHLDAAKQAGRGVLLVAGHHGNWEINALYAGLDGHLSGLYKAPRDPNIDRALTSSRARFGASLIAAGSAAMRDILKALRAGGTVGLLMDQQPRQGQGVFAPFFDRPALTMTLVQRLAQRTGCAVVFSDCQRLPNGQGWSIEYKALADDVADADPVIAAGALNHCLENAIKQAPIQYLWLYKRYALQPEGWVNPYRASS